MIPAFGWTVVLLLSLPPVAAEANASGARIPDLIEDRVGASPATWPEGLPELRAAMRLDPRRVVDELVERLADERAVHGAPVESQIHSVCGNALTLLDQLTDERIGGETRAWIGYNPRDHRGADPSPQLIYGPWRGWLKARRDLPVDRWFWGLSFSELERLQRLMRRPAGKWDDASLQTVRELGRRAYPYLLDKLQDNMWAGPDTRYCDRANALLERLTEQRFGEIEKTRLLQLGPADPLREHEWAVSENRASMALFRQRWSAYLLSAS